jgi:hypothetical protein
VHAALLCKRCSGSLPAPSDESPFVACSYCGTTHVIGPPRLELRLEPPKPSEYDRRRAAIDAAWDEARAHAPSNPTVALRAVLALHCRGVKDEQEAERAARLAERLLDGFDKEHGTEVKLDKNVVTRVCDASVKAVIELRSVERTELNLPFLTATPAGPLHLAYTMKQSMLPHLDGMPVIEVAEAAAPTPQAEPEPPKKKRGWWPFG